MVGPLLIALTFAATASALSYVDYSGVKMPHYDGSADYDSPPSRRSEDYHGHSIDVSASLDYKYEEQPNIKTDKPLEDLEDSEVWSQNSRKHRELITNKRRRNKHDNYNDYDDDIPKLKMSHPFLKHRSRLKTDDDLKEEILPRRLTKFNRDRKETSNIDRQNYQIDKDYIREDKIKELDDDIKFRETIIKKSNRRRPRDKQFKKQQKSNLLDEYEQDLEADRQNISELEKEGKYSHHDNVEKRRQSADQRTAHYRPVIDEKDENRERNAKVISGENKKGGYDEYEDYYDMKRVNNIKNNLPILLRRTTVKVPVTNTNLLDLLMTQRRLMVTTPGTPPKTTASSFMTNSLLTRSTTVTKTISTTTTVTTSEMRKKQLNEPSLAEKSRLSILKKAQRKEGMSFHPTKKPPVLLQVTSHMPTVVMVEPPSPSEPSLYAKEFLEDSPESIQKVKRLMRQKLVAEAKSLHELTENWDTIVCDYIDINLINGNRLIVQNMCLIIFLLYLAMLVVN